MPTYSPEDDRHEPTGAARLTQNDPSTSSTLTGLGGSAAWQPPQDLHKSIRYTHGLPQGTLGRTYSADQPPFRVDKQLERQRALDCYSDEEDALYTEHGKLVDKKFAEGLSTGEQRRLDMIRWKLHRIQDARQGYELDDLSMRVSKYVKFAAAIDQLKAELLDDLPQKSRS
jgi:hypothetical protein